ncbi:PREDICTED: probable protein phosphatase 2C 65 isoform X2 [Tarenaya hassleriana]|nr:PREDICTED: probable protein phosphatase 2C 65 isoform X2 [Tarenaya hassleriana]
MPDLFVLKEKRVCEVDNEELFLDSKNIEFRGIVVGDETDNNNEYVGEEDEVRKTDDGAVIRSRGSSEHISMAIQQGKKGINQDAMTVWENFAGLEDMIFCGVFDGHGPMGHKIARHVRENLPSMLHSAIRSSRSIIDISFQNHEELFHEFKAVLTKSFKYVDDEIGVQSPYESFCSGTTAVTIIKRGDSLVIANLGDSRAILCTRGGKSQLQAVQLTVDLKPRVPGEAERIKACKGRVFAMEEEPEVYRVWMPDDDCPGLAMSRAFGDFCLKDYGLLSIPDVFFRRVTSDDEFVVLATDGIWDVLTNEEVVKTVASTKERAKAAERVVERATRAWRIKYPISRADDCAVVVLFLNHRPVSGSFRSTSSKTSSSLGATDSVMVRVNSKRRLSRRGSGTVVGV